MSVERIKKGIEQWIATLSTTMNRANVSYASQGPLLTMPRAKDIVITYQGDEANQPEQAPLLFAEIGRFKWDSVSAGVFKGTVYLTIMFVDEGKSSTEVQLKASRWMDVLTSHCRTQQSIIAPSAMVNPTDGLISLGMKKGEGDVNAFQITLNLVVTASF